MAIALTNATRITHVKVDYSEVDLATLTTLVAGAPGTYSEKVFKILDTGLYYYVDAGDTISAAVDTIDAGKAAVDGPIDFTSGQIDYPTLTATVNDLDPTGSGSDGVNVLNLANATGGQLNVRGIVAPNTGKSMIIYNDGPDNVRLQSQNANATAANRFDIGGNLILNDKEAVMVWYDVATTRWRALRI